MAVIEEAGQSIPTRQGVTERRGDLAAQDNRVRYGRTSADRSLAETEAEQSQKDLDGKRLD